ncbi:MAG: FAD:protein FMN transferase [Phycisphaerales bacterium]
MGVPAKVVLYAPTHDDAVDAAAAAFDRIGQLDDCMSDYRPRSELMRLCAASAAGPSGPIPVSADLFDVLTTARAVSEASGGAFDVTVGPLVKLWRQSRRDLRLPDQQVREAARASVGYNAVELNGLYRTVSLSRRGMQLDLGGIGKGYAAQRAVERLRERGYPRCLVSMSGDIVAGDPPPGGDAWTIDLPAPILMGSNPDGCSRSLLLCNAAVSTSGDSQQFIEIAGERYSHILDPRTGLGVRGGVMCTIMAPRGELSDSLASAVCVSGPGVLPRLHSAFPGVSAIVWPAPDAEPIISDPSGQMRLARPRAP